MFSVSMFSLGHREKSTDLRIIMSLIHFRVATFQLDHFGLVAETCQTLVLFSVMWITVSKYIE